MRVVLLHAFPLGPEMWEGQRIALSSFDPVAPRLYGRGSSIDQWARDLLGELDEDELLPVGASMGGYCALALARLAHERLRGLALVGSRALPDSPEKRRERDELAERAWASGLQPVWQAMRPTLFPEGADPAVVGRARAMAELQRPQELAEALLAMRDRPDSTEVVRRLPVPLLVVAGQQDVLFQESRELARLAPQGEFHGIAGSGHLPALEQPDELDRILLDFAVRAA
ncbi:MAG: alpha/beta fold hydrolase [Gaiellaceae bacterium]